jgi:hypothetical protein
MRIERSETSVGFEKLLLPPRKREARIGSGTSILGPFVKFLRKRTRNRTRVPQNAETRMPPGAGLEADYLTESEVLMISLIGMGM